MSMYHMMTGGFHPFAGLWLSLLKVNPGDCNRLRNAYIVDSDDGPVIYVLCREQDNPFLEKNPRFLRSQEAMPGDNYWEFEFSIPKELHEKINEQGEAVKLPRFAEHFKQMMSALEGDPESPDAKAMLERAKPLMEQIMGFMEKSSG